MLNRAAESLYWMSRHLERGEAAARLLDVNLGLSMDLGDAGDGAWAAVVATTGNLEPFLKAHGPVTRAAAVGFLACGPENPDSMTACVRAARENARSVREYLPGDAWEALNALHLLLSRATPEALLDSGRLAAALEAVRWSGRHLEGLLATSLLRDEGWRFSVLGRSLERADQTSRLVDVQHALLEPGGGAHEALRWEAVAKSADALAMYRRRHGGTEGRKVAEFLLLDGAFPRSAVFCLGRAEEALRAINGTPAGGFGNAAEKALGSLTAELRYTEMDDLLGEGLHLWLDRFQTRLNRVGEELRSAYFPAAAGARTDPGARPGEDQQ